MATTRNWKVVTEQVASFVLIEGGIDEFALQRYDTNNIDWLSDRLQESRSPLDRKELIDVGDVHTVLWKEDRSFYRAKVDKIEKSDKGSGNKYHVTFIDYGNKDVVERKHFYQLEEELKNIPRQSVKCKLKNLILPGDDGDSYIIGSRRDSQEFFNRIFRRKGVHRVYAVLHPVPWKNSDSDPDFEVDLSRAEDALNSFVAENYSKVQTDILDACKEKCQNWLSSLNDPEPIVPEDTIKIHENVIDGSKSEVILSVSDDENKPVNDVEYVKTLASFSINYRSLNGSVPCLIEKVVSPNLFYIYILDPKEQCLKLPSLMPQMTEYFSAAQKIPASLQIGQIVAVYDADEKGWFRGEIEDFDKDKCQVYLVDFGESLSVTRDKLSNLPKKFAKLPKLAFACKLKGIKPVQSDVYNQQVIDFCTKMADPTSGKTYYFKYETDSHETPLPIDLYLDEACTKSVNEELVKNKMAEYIDSKPNWDPMLTDYMSPRPLVPDFTDDYFTPVAEETKRLCRFYRFSGRCPSGDNCNFLHLQTGSAFNLKEEECAMTVAHNEVRLPEAGAEFPVNIPVVRHPNYFFIHILKRDETKQNKALSVLNEEMTQFYRSWINSKSARPFIPGEVVAAKFIDGNWYRARIIELIEEEENILVDDQSCIERVRVFFVDYGRIHSVDLLCLREMKTRFLHLPFQAVECSLGTVMPSSSCGGNKSMKWPENARQEFHKLTNDENTLYKAKVLTNNGGSRLEIQLWATDHSGHTMDVGEKLVSLRLAQPCQQPSTTQKLVVFPG